MPSETRKTWTAHPLIKLLFLPFFLQGAWLLLDGISVLVDSTEPHRWVDTKSSLGTAYLGGLLIAACILVWRQRRSIPVTRLTVQKPPDWRIISLLALAALRLFWPSPEPPLVSGDVNLHAGAATSDFPEIFVRGQKMLITNQTEKDWHTVDVVLNGDEGGFAASIPSIRARKTVTIPLSRFKAKNGTALDIRSTTLCRVETSHDVEDGNTGTGTESTSSDFDEE